MPSPRFTLRVAPETMAAWKKAAKKEGLSVSALIHQRMNGEVVGTYCGEPLTVPADSRAAEVARQRKTKPASTSTASVPCKHPKGARVVLNGGLVRCGACGDLVK